MKALLSVAILLCSINSFANFSIEDVTNQLRPSVIDITSDINCEANLDLYVSELELEGKRLVFRGECFESDSPHIPGVYKARIVIMN